MIPEFPPEFGMVKAGTIGVAADILWYVREQNLWLLNLSLKITQFAELSK